MAGDKNRPHTEGSEEVTFGKKLLLFTLLCAAGFLLFKAFNGDEEVVSTIPRAMQVTYVPSDFKMQLDNQKTLEILSNPQRYKNEFDQLILDFNTNLVVHVANRMNLTQPQKAAAVNEYRKMHPSIRQMYFNDFISLGDSTNKTYQTWYENESSNAVDLLNEVASKYTCFFITNIIGTILKTQDGKLAVNGKAIETPCGIALTEGLRPLVKRLQETAAIRDFSRAHNLMKERVERAITELAVMEVKDKKGIRIQNASKLLGYNVSTTELEIVAMSIMKVGFNLQNYFSINVDDRNKTVIVTLPQPQILSHEVYPKVENLDIGLMRDLTSQDFNDNVNKLRQAFREDAMKSDIFTKSQVRAQEVMNMMLQPMVRNINKSYKIAVQFQNPKSMDYDINQQQSKSQTKQPLKR
ncbi:MAG: DUF4230 domain-containing protein [Saprospiraceae bacterium]|nr:DUF4230 domain-containing protein [Saprospiraceae bacterium]